MKKRTKPERYFAVCINNKKYKASLSRWENSIGSFLIRSGNPMGIYA